MKSNSRDGKASLESVECSGPPTMLSGGLALALEQQVGLADGVGLGVDLLAVEVRGDLLAVLGGESLQRLLGDGEHAAGAAGAVVEQVGARLDLVGDRQEDQVRHQLDGVARRPVLAGLLVVLLVEAADQLLEDRAHGVVVEAGCLTQPSPFSTGFGLRLIVGSRNFSISVPSASAFESRGIWLRNSKLSRISWTFGEKPSR